ncbi:element excision factor XisI family protein [Plectonema radiosum]|uniref:element excision factor XisI family protein n=1 Tax=Plectonema radiosum TaxID=945768 RepID=UPI002AD2ECBC|nr:element excision factor XisI family protein [Plectonema radiosum]
MNPNVYFPPTVRLPVYETFFQRKFVISAVAKYQLRLMIYDVEHLCYLSMAVEQYRQYIRHILEERKKRASMSRNYEEYEVQTIFDEKEDHYQLLYVGWRGNKRDEGLYFTS